MKKDFNKLFALVVDDDVILQVAVQKELESIGIRSAIASNGYEALQALQNEKFDFVLMDISMPEQDGMDTTRWIRDLKNSRNQNLPIFAVTSFDDKQHTAEIIEAGFNEHIIKPFELTQLVKLLEKYFWTQQQITTPPNK